MKVYKIGKVYLIAKNAAEAMRIKKQNGLSGVLVEFMIMKQGA